MLKKGKINIYVNDFINLSDERLDEILIDNWKLFQIYQDDNGVEIITFIDKKLNRYLDFRTNQIVQEDEEVTDFGNITSYKKDVEVSEYEIVKDGGMNNSFFDSDEQLNIIEKVDEFLKTSSKKDLLFILRMYESRTYEQACSKEYVEKEYYNPSNWIKDDEVEY